METKNKKPAFTLAEVMVVLLVLTIMFAAFAPFITKRRRTATKQEMWLWSTRNYLAGPMDAYYKPVKDNDAGGIYFGVTPDSQDEIQKAYLPVSKVVIRSGYIANNVIQRQLQFRYGRNNFDDPGQFAGSFIADNTNLLLGGAFPMLKYKESDSTYPSRNTAFGFNALNAIKDYSDSNTSANNVTALGYAALQNNYSGKDNTAVGAGAGDENLTGALNTFIGYNAGILAEYNQNTLIGYKSSAKTGNSNTFVGANTGKIAENTLTDSDTDNFTGANDFENNVAIGYKALNHIKTGKNNIAIGSGALLNLEGGNYNVAIGYGACAGLTNQSYKTCIGANSGPASDTPVKSELGFDNEDKTIITYIGPNPNLSTTTTTDDDGNPTTTLNWTSKGKYGGDAALEIYNTDGFGNDKLINDPSIISNVTTVINGNLIVRGQTYFTIGSVLYPFYYTNNVFGTNAEVNCANNQLTYDFSNNGRCSTLSPITSDRRLKNINGKFNYGLDKLKSIKVYNYKFKDDKNTNHVGVIAQELQKVFPQSVFQDDNGYLKIRWDEMFYAAINSIKELNNKITSMFNVVSKLEKEIEKLEKENNELHTKTDKLAEKIKHLKKSHSER